MKKKLIALFVAFALVGGASFLYGNVRLIGSVLLCLALFLSLVAFRNHSHLGERLSLLSLGIMGYTILYISSCLWGPYGTESLHNAASLLIATTTYVFLLAFSDEKIALKLPGVFCGGCGAIALLSLDASSTQLLTRFMLIPILEQVGGPGLDQIQYEEGMRIVGLVGGANVLAGLLGIGTLLSLYIFMNASDKYKRFSAIVLIYNASVFFLAFSMGALYAFALAIIAYLVFSLPKEKGRVFTYMVVTATLALVSAGLMTIGLGRYGSVASYFTLICPYIFGEFLAYISPTVLVAIGRLRTKISWNILPLIGGGVGTFIIAYIALALMISTPIKLNPWGTERVAYLSPGDYSLNLKSDQAVELLIASQNRLELLNGEYSYLYRGKDSQAKFTVPKEAGIVRFNFIGKGDLYQASYQGADKGEILMNSPLVPKFVANRMRGVFFSKNILERLAMSRDGLKLFASSPILGLGTGAFEVKAYSVQDHYYETKYVHNQYIQSMVDMGLLGLVIFITILGGTFYMLVSKRAQNPTLAAPLLACLLMGTFHGLTEVVWSMHAYVIFLLVLMAICDLAFPSPLKSRSLRAWLPRAYLIGVLGFSLAIVTHLFVLNDYQNPSRGPLTPEKIAYLAEIEPFSKEIYQLDYVCNYGAKAEKSNKYLEKLRGKNSYDINMLLLQYVYLPMGDEENIKTASREAYWDRQHDFEAVDRLYSLLLDHDAEKLFMEKGK